MDKNNSIGIFDSGVGGLTVVKSLLEQLPGESFIYYGDTLHVPYGNKSEQQLMGFARNIMSFLLEREVKAIVIACGTTSSVILPKIERLYTLPLLGVVKAGARCACRLSVNGRIGVAATQATVNTGAYTREIKRNNPGSEVFEIACPRFVPLVESGKLAGKETEDAVKEYVGPLLEQDIDTLILGCTHYPFLKTVIHEFAGEDINIVDLSSETVRELKEILGGQNLINDSHQEPGHEFYVSGNNHSFYNVGRVLLGETIQNVHRVNLD